MPLLVILLAVQLLIGISDRASALKYQSERYRRLHGAISDILHSNPKLRAKLEWGQAGLTMPELVKYLYDYRQADEMTPAGEASLVYRLYDSDIGRRTQIGKVVHDNPDDIGPVFALTVDGLMTEAIDNFSTDLANVRRYFIGQQPDRNAIVHRVLPEEMLWELRETNIIDMEVARKLFSQDPEGQALYQLYAGIPSNGEPETRFYGMLKETVGHGSDPILSQNSYFIDGKPDLLKVLQPQQKVLAESPLVVDGKPNMRQVLTLFLTPAVYQQLLDPKRGLSTDDIIAFLKNSDNREIRDIYLSYQDQRNAHDNRALRISIGQALSRFFRNDPKFVLVRKVVDKKDQYGIETGSKTKIYLLHRK